MDVNAVMRRVRAIVGDEGGSMVDIEDVVDLINDAMIAINLEAKVISADHGFNTVAGTNKYVLPPNFISARRFKLAGTEWLTPVARHDFLTSLPEAADSTVRSRPTHYSIEGLDLYLFPTPDAVYAGSLTYTCIPAPVTAAGPGTDVLPLLDYLQPVVVKLVYASFKERDEDFEASMMIRAQAFTELAVLLDNAHSGNESSYPSVRDVSDYG